MNEKKFRSLMAMAKSLQSVDADRYEYWSGFQRGLRRLYHGQNFGTDDEHQKFYNCRSGDYRRGLQSGYRAGFHYDDLKIESAVDVQPLRKLLGWTVADLAEIAAVSPRTIEGWEQGRPIPDPVRQLIQKYLMV